MEDAATVGGALYSSQDPNAAAPILARAISGDAVPDELLRRHGLDQRLIGALRIALPHDPERVRLACELGAAWVLGRRSIAPEKDWELVASMPSGAIPRGLNHATGETFISLIAESTKDVRFIAPFVDTYGLEVLKDSLAGAMDRGVQIEIFEPRDWPAATPALAELRRFARARSCEEFLHIIQVKEEGPWPHLKVMTVDERAAYIGSANITGAGLGGRNLELGVVIRGGHVTVINAILDTLCDASE